MLGHVTEGVYNWNEWHEEMHFARYLRIRWEESSRILVKSFWQALICWEMINSTNRFMDKPLQEGKNFLDLEIGLIYFG